MRTCDRCMDSYDEAYMGICNVCGKMACHVCMYYTDGVSYCICSIECQEQLFEESYEKENEMPHLLFPELEKELEIECICSLCLTEFTSLVPITYDSYNSDTQVTKEYTLCCHNHAILTELLLT